MIKELKFIKNHIHKAEANKMYLKLVTLVATNVGLEADGALVWTVRCGDDVAGSLQSIEKRVWRETDMCCGGKSWTAKEIKSLDSQQTKGWRGRKGEEVI